MVLQAYIPHILLAISAEKRRLLIIKYIFMPKSDFFVKKEFLFYIPPLFTALSFTIKIFYYIE